MLELTFSSVFYGQKSLGKPCSAAGDVCLSQYRRAVVGVAFENSNLAAP